MAKVIIIEGNEVYVVPNVEGMAKFRSQRIYDTYKGEHPFSKDIRRKLYELEINKLKKELYLVDEG